MQALEFLKVPFRFSSLKFFWYLSNNNTIFGTDNHKILSSHSSEYDNYSAL